MKHAYWALTACIVTNLGVARAIASEPTDTSIITPPVSYRSPFADYRPLGEDRNTPWKDANDTVGKVGGWRVYAREAADAIKAREAAGVSRSKADTPAPAKPAAPPAQTHQHGG